MHRIGSPLAKRRHQPEEDPGAQGGCGREHEYGAVDPDLVEPRKAWSAGEIESTHRRRKRSQESNPAESERDPCYAAKSSEDAGFGQRLAYQPGAPRTERGAEGELAPPRGCPREQQVGDVDAGDE